MLAKQTKENKKIKKKTTFSSLFFIFADTLFEVLIWFQKFIYYVIYEAKTKKFVSDSDCFFTRLPVFHFNITCHLRKQGLFYHSYAFFCSKMRFSKTHLHACSSLTIIDHFHSLAHSFVYLGIHSIVYSFVHLLTHPFMHQFIHLLIHPFINQFIHLLIHPFMHQFIHLLTHSFMHQFIHLLIRPFINQFIHLLTHPFMNP